MKFRNFNIPPKKKEEPDLNIEKSDFVTPSSGKEEQFVHIPLSEEDKNLSAKELSEKYELTLRGGYFIKERGYRSTENPNYIKKKNIKNENKEWVLNFFQEVTPLEINSIDSILGNPEDQRKINEMLEIYNKYKTANKFIPSNSVSDKKFTLLNGQELIFGDLVVLDKIIKLKMFRDKDGILMIFDDKENKFTAFNPSKFWGNNQSFTFKEVLSDSKNKNNWHSVESFSPHIFNLGIFREEDFGKRAIGTEQYEMYGPHERKISPKVSYVYLSNGEVSSKYYIGKEKFTGTDKRINHDTVRISLLDNKTGVVMDTINGKKTILYTFPFMTKEEFERQKGDVIRRRELENKPMDVNLNDYISQKAELKEYLITDYVSRNKQESDVDYANRISKLSDTSYVLGNFRSFMSETGLAANNYSWREQLILSDTLTSVEDKDKIINFGRNFKKDGMRTFLSIEQGDNKMGNKILELGNPDKLPEDVARKVFAKYNEIIDVADHTKNILEDILPNEVVDESQKEISEIRESLLVRAKDLLSAFYDKKENNPNDILKDLERYEAEILLYADTYKKLNQSGKEIKLEDIKNTKITILSQEEKEKMAENFWNITKANRPFIKDGSEEMINRENNFKQTIENKDSSFYALKHGDNVIAFCSFTPDENGDLYIESLNTESEAKGSHIGSEFLPSVLEKVKNLGKDIYGHVHAHNSGTLPYYERLGFDIKPVEENGELKYYEIRIPSNQASSIAA